MNMDPWRSAWTSAVVLFGLSAVSVADPPAAEPKRATPAEIAKLDARMKDLSESFLRETTTLIGSYESVGEYERAKALLEALRKLNPGNEAVKAKLADLDRRQLDAGEFEMELDPAAAWMAVGAVQKDRPLRVRVKGEYRFTATATVGAAGLPEKDLAADVVPGMPLGAIMGVIVTPGGAADKAAAKPRKPFLVGGDYERPADADGILYLKANLPPDTKCTGRLEALVSGATKP